MSVQKRSACILVLTCLGLGGFHLATLRPGHEWGDDFSLYVAHARNLAEGRPYAETGYIYNRHIPSLSPRAYPPGFPLLLAPVYRVTGMSLGAMKAFVVGLFVLTLLVVAALAARRLPFPYVALLVVLFGLNPLIWQQKDRLLSEAPFLLFTALALLLAEVSADAAGPRRRWLLAFLAAATAFFAFLTRTVGLMLVPAFVGCELWRRRRPGALTAAVLIVFPVGIVLQKMLLALDSSYADQVSLSPLLMLRITWSLVVGGKDFFASGQLRIVSAVLYLGVMLLALAGWLARRRDRLTPTEPFVLLSLVPLAVWPAAEGNLRFLLPLLPFVLLHACEGLHRLAGTHLVRLELPAAALLGVAILACYAARYTEVDWGAFRQGVTAAESQAFFEHVRDRTPPEAAILFPKPRALALYTGRKVSGVHVPGSDRQLWQYLDEVGITHVGVCRDMKQSTAVLEAFARRHPDRLREVYASGPFTLYQVTPAQVTARRGGEAD